MRMSPFLVVIMGSEIGVEEVVGSSVVSAQCTAVPNRTRAATAKALVALLMMSLPQQKKKKKKKDLLGVMW